MGNKPQRTRKCTCDNPVWDVWEVRETVGHEVVVTLDCRSCKSMWDSRSRESRKYADPDRKAFGSSKSPTYGEFFKMADGKRKEWLLGNIKILEGEIKEAEKAILKARNEVESLG